MTLEPQDRRRYQSKPEQPAANRQTALLKLQSGGPVFVATFVERPSYPATAGAGSITSSDSTRETLCWADQTEFSVDDLVIAVLEGNRYYAVGKLA